MGSPRAKSTLSGVPGIVSEPNRSTSTELHLSKALEAVPPEPEPENNRTLTGVPADDTLPDLALNQTGVITDSGVNELEAANVLLSLGDSLESTLDDEIDNADLMPIGGEGTVPIDVAPQPL